MKKLQSSCLLPSSFCALRSRYKFVVYFWISFYFENYPQVINYVSNGSFEEVLTNTATPLFYSAKYWGATDSSKFSGELLSATTAPIKVPVSNYTYQWPKHGNNQMISLQYCPTCPNNKRGYLRNRLKTMLMPNTSYCLSMYVNLSNNSSYAIGPIGAYFVNSDIDTISACNIALTYINPQIENSINNVITDTLNWKLIQGIYSANGTEKYVLIGNFKSDNNSNPTFVNPTYSPAKFADYLFDYVSLIELSIPTYAGRDTVVFSGDSIFIGRLPEVGLDEACIWYKMPSIIPIDTIAGFWIKPTETCTYVVRQEICGLVKWDTVKIFMDAVGLGNQNLFEEKTKLYPNPTNNILNISCDMIREDEKVILLLFDNLCRKVREEEITFKNGHSEIKILDLDDGVYVLQLTGRYGILNKKIIIAR